MVRFTTLKKKGCTALISNNNVWLVNGMKVKSEPADLLLMKREFLLSLEKTNGWQNKCHLYF